MESNFVGEIICQSLPLRIQCRGDSSSCLFTSDSICSFLFFREQQQMQEEDDDLTLVCYEILTKESQILYIYYVLRSDDHDDNYFSLSVGNYYLFQNFKLFDPCQCLSSSPSFLSPTSSPHLLRYLYGSTFLSSSISSISSSPYTHTSSHIIYKAENISLNYPKYFRPHSILEKDEYCHRPIHLQGIICRAYQSFKQIFWIEILNKTKYLKGESFFIYFSYRYSYSEINFTSFSIGDSIIFFSVYPIYLWGRLHGFAMTSRSWFQIQRRMGMFFPASSSSLDHTAGKKTQTEKQSISCKDLHLTSSLHNLFHQNCSLFIAWSAYTNRRIKQCVSSSSTCHYHASDHGRLLSIIISILNLPLGLFVIPNHITFGEEFIRRESGPLFTIRAGYDFDYLCHQLPEVRAPTSSRRRFYYLF
jgi:hypothetical protein